MPPLLDLTIEPKLRSDAARLFDALSELVIYDPMMSFHLDSETGQTLLHGASEAHLDGHIETLRATYKIDVSTGAKQVAYRETLGEATEIKHTHIKRSGGAGQFAEVRIVFEPLARNAGVAFENNIPAGILPAEYISAIESGVRIQAETGVLAGFPTVDFTFKLVDAKYHDLDSSALAFEIAAKACFRELGKTGLSIILEPIMKVDILSPLLFVESITADLLNRRGLLSATRKLGITEIVTALVPFKEMFGYGDALSHLSQGRARFVLRYQDHDVVPHHESPNDLFPSAMAMRA